jgi:crotonobetainyl-CoA:carnitine CoA-transferase CaiB-like acyl-CoA transferase
MLSHVLADFGADVIKVEHPEGGDDLRKWREQGHALHWKLYGRNKRSWALDLREPQSLDRLISILPHCQVLIENFVPGGLEKLGLEPERLLTVNPALILVRISGWGQDGPYAKRPGFGTLVEAMSGFAYLNGFPDRPPSLPPLALADMVAGLYGASAVQTALRVAEKTGKGQCLDLSLFEPILSVIASEAAKSALTGLATLRAGNQSSHTAPRNVYRCADGGFLALSGSMQSMAMRLFDAIDRSDLKTDPRFISNDARVEHRDALDAILSDFIGSKTLAENLALFEQAKVTAGPVCSVLDLLDHPYVAGRESLVRLPDDDLGEVVMHEVLPRLSQTPGGFRRPAPTLGQHTQEIEQWLESLANQKEDK